jgi:hypothetical protein
MTNVVIPEKRRPHRDILQFLGDMHHCLDDVGASRSRDAIANWVPLIFSNQIDDALGDLLAMGLVIRHSHPRDGELYTHAKYHEQIDAPRDEYEGMKLRVTQAAERHGWRTSWSERRGWRLVTPAGREIAQGNMRELEEYLLSLAQRRA